MSGDVQPRKRKDKKRKKDDLGVEETRGTAAVFGEGDVFMHSQHDHGTGGHWCAKIIFFSLLAVLISLIGLIILENRGLSELEANAVESRYSGVLEGWLEDVPDDDHHDEHTLELNHQDGDDQEERHEIDEGVNEGYIKIQEIYEYGEPSHEEDEEQEDEYDINSEEDEDNIHSEEDEDDINSEEDENLVYKETKYQENNNEDEAESHENTENEDEDDYYSRQQLDSEEKDFDEINDNWKGFSEEIDNREDPYDEEEDNKSEDSDKDDVLNKNDNSEEFDNFEDNENLISKINDESEENLNEDDDNDDDHNEDISDEDIEIERLEMEKNVDEEPISTELPALPEDDDDDGDKTTYVFAEILSAGEDNVDQEEYLEADDFDGSPEQIISAPAGKPLIEMEEETSSEKPPKTLDEEEEYEQRQEELRREEEQSSHMWLKLTVGGALLVATHAVMRRARASRDMTDDQEELTITEEVPLTDRRMTLIPEESIIPVSAKDVLSEIPKPKLKSVLEIVVPPAKSIPNKQEIEEEDEINEVDEEEAQDIISPTVNKELYSDDELEDEEIVPETIELPKQTNTESIMKTDVEPEPEDEDPDDVEIIDEEQLEEELIEEEDEDISDVDDAELLSRLEAKYGKLPEPERPNQKHKDGGNSIEDDWPGEPSDTFWRQQLDSAERELDQGDWRAAVERASASGLRDSARARYLIARALDRGAEENRDNRLLSRAITAYLHLLKMNERLSDKQLMEITQRTLDRIQFRGNYLNAEPVYRLLIRRFPQEPAYRNNLTVSFLMANRPDLAEAAIHDTLKLWPDDRLALAHHGFVLKTRHNRYEEAAEAFRKALEGDAGLANEARFYYHYGDSLLLLGRPAEAHEVHKRGAALGHFLSPSQRSLYNVPRLKSSPWWQIEGTPYIKLAKILERSWRDILKEGQAAAALYEQEKEGLKEKGDWSQLDLFVRGQEIPGRCKRAPVTCSIVKAEPAAFGCRRGQIKFSSMAAGTHVRAHVGPTNCRLRMHLGLSNTKDTYIRVDKEIRQWQTGKVFMFDDSFEHEVWHNGTGTRLVLIVDVWHPQLTAAERRQLPAI